MWTCNTACVLVWWVCCTDVIKAKVWDVTIPFNNDKDLCIFECKWSKLYLRNRWHLLMENPSSKWITHKCRVHCLQPFYYLAVANGTLISEQALNVACKGFYVSWRTFFCSSNILIVWFLSKQWLVMLSDQCRFSKMISQSSYVELEQRFRLSCWLIRSALCVLQLHFVLMTFYSFAYITCVGSESFRQKPVSITLAYFPCQIQVWTPNYISYSF